MADSAKNVTIVGAGLVGSLLGVMLARRGYQVTIYEKRPDLRVADISAGRSINLALAARGIGPLTEADLMQSVEPLLVPMKGRMLHDVEGQLEFQPYGQRPDELIYSVSRGELNRLMMTAAEATGSVDIHFQMDCNSIDFEQNMMEITDTTTNQSRMVNFNVLLGADGAGSVVRKSLVAATGAECSVEFLDHRYKELCIPADANGNHQMDREALHVWPRGGFMLIALPNLDGSYTVTLFLKSRQESGAESATASFEELDTPDGVNSFFRREFPDAFELIPNLANEFAVNPSGPLGTVRCRKWSHRRALILGDASHAIVPFHGQGMNAGFEDCSELIKHLDAANGDWDTAIQAFAVDRPAHADAIADMAIENYITMRDSVRDPQFQLRKTVGFALERDYPDRFIPRYSMVMFHRIPYADVFARGVIQDQLLNEATADVTDFSHVDLAAAGELVAKRLPPIVAAK